MTFRLLAAIAVTALAAQLPAPPPGLPARDRAYDVLLDTNVRDGLVYYNAVKGQRGMLASYIASLDVSPGAFDAMSRDEQMSLLINAYNAIVLKTVADHYPIAGRVETYPKESIRQIPGAFERKHRVAGRSVSLDELERWLLDTYKDPRVVCALGRGAVGGGRLRSEASYADRLEDQLAGSTAEFVKRTGHFRIDEAANVVTITPLYSWRDDDFAAAFGDKADPICLPPFKEPEALLKFGIAATNSKDEDKVAQASEWLPNIQVAPGEHLPFSDGEFDVILLNDPTRGIDVGTKQELYRLMRELADAGKAILFYSTDYAELIGCCDRVAVMYDGRIVTELTGSAITEEALVSAALNITAPEAVH